MRTLFFIILFAAAPVFLQAQTISGSWYGRADVDLTGLYNNYLTELVIKQRGTRVDGIFGYYFRDKYQSYFIHGTYNPKTREITIMNLPVIYYGSNSTVNSIDCMTNFRGTLLTSRNGTKLMGTFYHDSKYKYMCPDLKVSYSLDREDKSEDSSTVMAARARIWKPQADDKVVDEVTAAAPVAPPMPADSLAAGADSATVKKADSGLKRTDSMAAMALVVRPDSAAVAAAQDQVKDSLKIIESFAKRKAVLNRELLVESDSIRLSFYDNGEIDGDSISVFVNHQLVLSHQGLDVKAFNIYLHLDSTRELTEVSMFAENLGRIPPNTALMVITDGKNRYEVFLSSSLTENATVELRRKRP
ncbi:MAG TPA: hypothetical protein VG101_15335 [Puia sp.]|jgi:hypothetical protein|nr:hypothetical protein [Puia sp.]